MQRCLSSFVRLSPRVRTSFTRSHVRAFVPIHQFHSSPFMRSDEAVPTAIPQVNEDEISDKVKDIADRMLKMDFISLCQFMDLLKEKTGIDPNSVSDMAASAGGGATAAAAAPEVVDTGFRQVIIREFTGGNLPVKEKFTIMKLMRAEQPDLSLADCKGRLDKAPCTIFDKVPKEKAEDIIDQLKGMAIVVIAETV